MSYNQPFYVGVNNPRFPTARNGWLPALESKETVEPEPVVKGKSIYFKMDRGAFELNRRVRELENSNRYLIRKLKEITGNASKRKAIYKEYTNE